jgi:hypothetical protein
VSWIVVAACATFAAGETEADEPALPLDVVAVDDGADAAPESPPVCVVKLIIVGLPPDDTGRVEWPFPLGGPDPSLPPPTSPPSSQGSSEVVPFDGAAPSMVVLFPNADAPLAEDVLVAFEPSCPVKPPETPVACILASASA